MCVCKESGKSVLSVLTRRDVECIWGCCEMGMEGRRVKWYPRGRGKLWEGLVYEKRREIVVVDEEG
jgi:hypothetical protein